MKNIVDIIVSYDIYLAGLFLVLLISYSLLGLDDFFIDLYFFCNKLGPRKLTPEDLKQMDRLPQKSIAIMVAAWKEDNVLAAMVNGNIRRMEYKNYRFFLGVYPNDQETLQVVRKLQKKHKNVEVVVNTKEGPTSKGQMINQVVNFIFDWEKSHDSKFDLIMFHDSEDMIHPKALKLINHYSEKFEFIQVPCFSLPLPLKYLVAGCYMDEFSESHLKDMTVRNHMMSPIPSAGVGTALSRNLVEVLCKNHEGNFLNPKALTEDYELGVSSTKYCPTRSVFACCYYLTQEGKKEFIATREYFPKKFWSSVRQRSRWMLGIAFQGTKNLGWFGNFRDNYFLFRDRKAPISVLLLLTGMVVSFYFILRYGIRRPFSLDLLEVYTSWGLRPHIFKFLVYGNLFFMVNRILQRTYFTTYVYGTRIGLLVPFRILVGNFLNACASLKAWGQFIKSEITGVAPSWLKTDHEIPTEFGEASSKEKLKSA